MQIERSDSGMTEEQEIDQLLSDLLADNPDQPDATPAQLAELDKLTDRLAEKLETHTYATETNHHS